MGIGLVGIVGVAYFVSNRMMFSNFVKGRKNKISEGESFEAHETICLMCGDYKDPKQTYCCADCSRYSNERVNPLGGKRGGGFPRGDIAKAVLTLKEYGGEMSANQWKARIRDIRPTRKELNTNEIHKLVRYLNPTIYIKTEGKPLTYQITGGNCYDDWAMERYQAESFGAEDTKGYYEPYAFCEWCSDEIQKESDAVSMRGEIICKGCKEAWGEQPVDGGFWAESRVELKRDSCCCGATKSNPCACMIKGVMECSAVEPKCPCYAAKDAESFSADDFEPIDWNKIDGCKYCGDSWCDSLDGTGLCPVKDSDQMGAESFDAEVRGHTLYPHNDCEVCGENFNKLIICDGCAYQVCDTDAKDNMVEFDGSKKGLRKKAHYCKECNSKNAESFGVDVIHRKDGREVWSDEANEYECGECESIYDNASDATICCKCPLCANPIHDGECIKYAESFEAEYSYYQRHKAFNRFLKNMEESGVFDDGRIDKYEDLCEKYELQGMSEEECMFQALKDMGLYEEMMEDVNVDAFLENYKAESFDADACPRCGDTETYDVINTYCKCGKLRDEVNMAESFDAEDSVDAWDDGDILEIKLGSPAIGVMRWTPKNNVYCGFSIGYDGRQRGCIITSDGLRHSLVLKSLSCDRENQTINGRTVAREGGVPVSVKFGNIQKFIRICAMIENIFNAESFDAKSTMWCVCKDCGVEQEVQGDGWRLLSGITLCPGCKTSHMDDYGFPVICDDCGVEANLKADNWGLHSGVVVCESCAQSEEYEYLFDAESFEAEWDFGDDRKSLRKGDEHSDFNNAWRWIFKTQRREWPKWGQKFYDKYEWTLDDPHWNPQLDAESFEAPREMEEEDFTPMDITQCHVCARPYEYSRIARALVQHYLKESKDGTMGWKTKGNPDGARRTVRNIAGYQLYWHGLGAIDNYMGEGKISRMSPLIIELLRTAIVPNIIAGDVVQFIESMEIDDIEDTDPKFFTDFSDTWEAPNDRLKPERPSDDTGDSRKDRNKPKKPWRAETESSK